jgi:hypothetical protein
MTHEFVPVQRADFYAHEDANGGATFDGITPMEIDMLSVEVNVRETGLITIGASCPDRSWDAYGIEIDITPAAARLLSSQLLVAADRSER